MKPLCYAVGMGQPDDSALLVERLLQGDEQAREVLLERYLPGLRAFVRLRSDEALRARESVSDLVQSACREVLQHADRFRHADEGAFRRWLYTTALRKIQDRRQYHRAQMRDAAREQPLRSGAGDDALLDAYGSLCTPSRELMSREAVERIERAFDRLSDDQREVICLGKLLGLPRAEVARRMGRSELAVRTLLSRALTKLASAL